MENLCHRGKRKLAFFLTLLLAINALSGLEMKPVQAAKKELRKIVVSVRTDADKIYQGADIEVFKSEEDMVSGGNAVSGNHAVTGDMGSCEFQVEDGNYEIIVTLRDEDIECYKPLEGKKITINGNDEEIIFNLERIKHSISIDIQGGMGGTVSGGDAAVPHGDSLLLTAIPDEGYYVSDVICGESSVLCDGSIADNTGVWTYGIESVTSDLNFQVRFIKKQYDITAQVLTGEKTGIITFDAEKVDHGAAMIFYFDAKPGYQLAGISINEVDVRYQDVIDYGKERYAYEVKDVVSRLQIKAGFSDIPISSDLSELIYEVKSKGEILVAQEDVYYAQDDIEVTFAAPKDKLFSVRENDDYGVGLTFTETDEISCIYTMDAVPAGFGTKKKYDLSSKPIRVCIDKEKPIIKLSEKQKKIWVAGECNKVDIRGAVSDDRTIDRIIWSEKRLTETEILTVSQGNVMKVAEGEFTITNGEISADETHYYIYAVDKAGNCSEGAEVEIYRDGTKPVITDAAIITENIRKTDFGNFYNGSIALRIMANDIAALPASGVKKVNIYAGDALAASSLLTPEETSKDMDFKEFIIPVSQSHFAKGAPLKLTVEDTVGNVSETYELTDFGMSSTIVKLETIQPAISIHLPKKECYQKTEHGGEENWYNKVPNLECAVAEVDGSGLYSGRIYQTISGNGQVEMSEYAKNYGTAKAVYIDSIKIAAERLTGVCEGKNTIYASFTDQAGNTGFVSQDFYLDRTAPKITGFTIEQAPLTSVQKVLNKLGFGTFSNGMLTVEVYAEDIGESSGLGSISLYLDGILFETKKTDKSSKAVFTIPQEDISDNAQKVYLDKRIYAQAVDNVGNASSIVRMTTGNSNLADSRLMIENILPSVTIDVEKNDFVEANGILYVKDEFAYEIKVADEDSGIGSIKIICNDAELMYESYQYDIQEKRKSFTIHMRDIKRPSDNIYRLSVVAVDNAGNEKVLQAKEICFDAKEPSILNFVMEAEGSVEAEGTEFFYENTDYGYYFRTDTRVEIYAGDGEKDKCSGVKSISYYLLYSDGERGEVITSIVDAEEKISFVVPAGFKGQIYACATDYLNNTAERYATPAGLVAESAQLHGREEHIVISRPGSSAKDINGLDLYGGSIIVDVNVQDTFSGIRRVEWSVTAPQNAERNQSGFVELDNNGHYIDDDNDSWDKTHVDKNLVTGMHRQIQIDHNSNAVTLTVTMTDRAGNISSESVQFSIDTTVPVITLSFDGIEPDEEFSDTYGADRVATITVKERNFSIGNMAINVTNEDGDAPQITGWNTAFDTLNPDESVSTTNIVFSEDGQYTLEVSGKDAAGHEAVRPEEYKFIIDKTMPQITVNFDNEESINGNYYAADRTATILIVDHNFEENRVHITGTAVDDGASVPFPAVGNFVAEGDVHMAVIHFTQDANYSFEVACSDRAGNQGETYVGEAFFVDKTAPEIVIKGVDDMSANNGEVVPVIELTDTNYDENGVTIELSGVNRGIVTVEGSFDNHARGQIFTCADFPQEQMYDDLYTLRVALKDRAGNESQDSIMFSVNRFGSVYVFDDSLKSILGTYIQKEQDLKLSEINVDNLEHDTIRVVIDVNGNPRDLVEGQDYNVVEKGGAGSWYRYDYTIDADLFSGDGRYIVTIYSKDRAQNVNENIDEAKKAEISFGVDKTPPVVVPIDITSNEQYAMDVKTSTVTVNDNLVLKSVDIFVGDKECDYIVNGDSYIFDISDAVSRQDVTVVAMDAAGNRTDYVISDVLVTSNAIVRFYNNTPLLMGSLIGVAAAGGGAAGLLTFRRRRRIRIK